LNLGRKEYMDHAIKVLQLTAMFLTMTASAFCDDVVKRELKLKKHADAQVRKGNLDGAIADYTEGIKLNPSWARAYLGRGDAKKAKGDLDGAIADFTHAIELNNGLTNNEAYERLANAKKAKSRWVKGTAGTAPLEALAFENRAVEPSLNDTSGVLVDLAAGQRAHAAGDYATALNKFLLSARQGNAVAQFGLGIMLREWPRCSAGL
jgi:tetratricopeptide (TPR) repeat protein